MKTILLLFASVSLFAQTLTPTSSAVPAPGLPFPVSVVLSGAPTSGPGISAVQFTASIPSGWTITGASTVSGKLINCAASATPPAPGKCIVYGLDNSVALVNGTVATITYLIPSTATSGTSVINISGLSTVDTSGNLGGAASGNNLNVAVVSYDLNGDGVVSAADVTLEVSQVLGIAACTNGDLTGDGNCRLNDLYQMVAAWVSYGSHATP